MKKTIKNTWRALAARPSFHKINLLMFDCSLRGLGVMNFENDVVSGERHFVRKVLPHYMTNGASVIFDVGANHGEYSQLLKSYHPDAILHAFEPNPKTYEGLQENLAGCDITVVNKGLGRENAVLKFYERKDFGGSSKHGSLYKEVIESFSGTESVEFEVDITSLDSYAAANNLSRITLLKIDTEGHELEVLKGAKEMLANDQIDLVQIEFNKMNIVSRVFFRDFANALPNHVAYRLLPAGAIKLKDTPLQTELFAFQNIVFVHKRFKPNGRMLPAAICNE